MRSPQLLLHGVDDFLCPRVDFGVVFSFEHHAQERLGARVSDEQPAVVLEPGFDAAKKIGIIKVVRELAGLGLAEAKAFVEGAPKNVKEGVDKATAEKIKKSLEDAGAKVSIKPAG